MQTRQSQQEIEALEHSESHEHLTRDTPMDLRKPTILYFDEPQPEESQTEEYRMAKERYN